MDEKRRWIHTAVGKMTIAYVVTALIVVSVVAAIAMFANNIALQIIMTVVGLVVFAAISLIIGKYITNKIESVSKRLQDISDGDVHTFTDKLKAKTEFEDLYNTLEDTVVNLNEVINEINNGLDKLAEGDLNYRLPDDWKGDFRLISHKYNDITASLRKTFRNIDSASSQVSNGSQQVADGAQTLSQGATEQAASIDQLNDQISTISKKVDNTADFAANAMKVVNDTGDKIRECGDEMSQMLTAMDDINKSSAEISKIIKVIDDIAFQTNILALNAAVEAARAGNAGKGFAVVADEVRNLAAKSAEAANQTTSLIENSIESVKRGADIAHETAGTLDKIVKNASLISDEVAKISDASNEQASEIRRVSQGVEQIAAVVQSNTATAEESAATSEELSGQSGVLRSLLAHFKIDGEDAVEETAENTSETNYSETFDSYVNSNNSSPFDEPASAPAEKESDFVPVDFPAEDEAPAKQKPAHIYLDDDFENVQSKY
ncbi:MAG: methyl-accepting chemotaxis protein [Oscillospiraceae bacterium]|nr:methyl-accepting chemotaxis protein [Oscillospiraceae bacterium]MDD7279552.1 methyl-accepting chemotaxis protein [Oscillospiraceae bacterium]MDY2863434.1 methyl-accepting chemotaxis protein [Oscillospiraceae bacterium]